jgi:fluoroquinolone resistance protein
VSALSPGSFHEGVSITNLDLLEEQIDNVELLGCTMSDCQLGGTTLDRCSFEDVTFERCDWNIVKLGGSSFRGVRFLDCKLTGIDWSRAHDLTFDVTFIGCVLDFSSFVGMRLADLKSAGGKGHDVVFADCNLRGASLADMDLAGTTFTGNDMRGTDLSTCANVVLEPNTNRLHATKLPLDASLRYLKQLGIIVPLLFTLLLLPGIALAVCGDGVVDASEGVTTSISIPTMAATPAARLSSSMRDRTSSQGTPVFIG